LYDAYNRWFYWKQRGLTQKQAAPGKHLDSGLLFLKAISNAVQNLLSTQIHHTHGELTCRHLKRKIKLRKQSTMQKQAKPKLLLAFFLFA
jgi:hypothetical protein